MRLTFLFIIILAFTLSAQQTMVSEKGNIYSADRLIVKMKEGKTPQHDSIKQVRNLFLSTYVVYGNTAELERELSTHSDVIYVEKDFHGQQQKPALVADEMREQIALLSGHFNDPKLSSQWTFLNSEENGISVNRAYSKSKTSPKQEIIVAVVDTGVDYAHEDLKDVMWKNPGEIAGNNIDDDNNGYVDDIYGINTLIRDSNGNATVDIKDTHSHGTHVSGTIAACQNNNTGVAGIASRVKIMALRTVPNSSDEKDVDVIEAFMYAAKNGARVINCSFGKNHNEGGMAVSEAIDHIGQKYGVLVVAAAGNSSRDIDTNPTYPASFANETLLVVASTTRWGDMSYFSNYGKVGVDVAAPGSSIMSTTPGNRYSSMSGTSMASPTTAGVAAEVLANNPNLTPAQLKKVLMDSTIPVPEFSGKIVTGGRVDLERALDLAKKR